MPSVQAPHRGHRPLPRGCRIRMRTRRCPGHRTDGSRPWLQRRPAPTGSHEDGAVEPAVPDSDPAAPQTHWSHTPAAGRGTPMWEDLEGPDRCSPWPPPTTSVARGRPSDAAAPPCPQRVPNEGPPTPWPPDPVDPPEAGSHRGPLARPPRSSRATPIREERTPPPPS